MELSEQAKRYIDGTLERAGLAKLSLPQATSLAEYLTQDGFSQVCQAVRAGNQEALGRLSHLVQIARAHSTAVERLALANSSIERLDAARSADSQRFVSVFTDAINGDQDAVRVIRLWLAPANDEMPAPAANTPPRVAHQVTRAGDSRSPIHETSVAPPPAGGTQPPVGARPSSAPTSAPGPAANVRHINDHRPPRDERDEREPAHSGLHAGRDDPRTTRSAPARPSGEEPQRKYDQVIVYGRDRKGGTALNIEHSPTRDRLSTTINLSLARAKGQKTQDGVDWSNKITMMLEPHEVTLILSVLLGRQVSARFAGHGQANDKWIEVSEIQDDWAGGIAFTLAQGKGQSADIRSCSASYIDIGEVIAIFNRAQLSQLRGTDPIPGHVVAARVADLYAKSLAAKERREQKNQQQGGAPGRR